MTLLLVLVVQFTFAQQKTITGTVSDSFGMPIPGVNLIVKGTTNGTLTDFDGHYTIEVNLGEVLTASFVGYETKEKTIGESNTLNFSLLEGNLLNEVVVTAMGIKRDEKSLGYAVTKISGESLSAVKPTSVASGLSGRVAGVNITTSSNLGGSTNVIIRGGSSITGNNQALYVVDGIPISNASVNGSETTRGGGGYDFGNMSSDINPDDIASISILKGASATALYGSRGSNGVILITTKKGTSSDRLGINFSSSLIFDQINKATLPNYQNQYGGGNSSTFSEETINGKTFKVVNYGEDQSWGPKFDASIDVLHWDGLDEGNPDMYLKTRPWTVAKRGPEAFFRTGVSKINSIALNGSNDLGNFRVSMSNTDQEGTVPNSKLKRNTISFNGTLNLSEKLSTTVTGQYINAYTKNRPGTGYDYKNSLSFMASAGMWMQTNVDYDRLKEYTLSNGEMQAWNRGATDKSNPAFWENPYWTVYNNFPEDERNRLIGSWSLNYEINDWLSAVGRMSLDHYDFDIETRIAKGSFGTSRYTKSSRKQSERNYDLMLNINKNITDDFNITGMFGVAHRTNQASGIGLYTTGGLVIDGLYTISNSVSDKIGKSDWASEEEVNSAFGTMSFGYKNTYFVDLSARNDWSSTLPEKNNSFFYPSISGSFIFSKLYKPEFLSFGKIRANWAQVGNGAPFARLNDIYYNNGNFGEVIRYVNGSTKYNDQLKPETQESYEIGVDLKFFHNRLGIDASYYNKKSKDQIIPGSVSFGTGYYSEYVNAGEKEDIGYEVALFATPIKNKNFTWNTAINWSTNKSMINALAPGITSHVLNSNHVSVVARVGEPYGILVGTDYKYDGNGNKLVDKDGYYLISDDDQIIGDINPDWRAGVSNTFTYKKFTLSTLIDIKMGGDLFSLTHYWGKQTGILEETVGLNDLGNDLRNSLDDGGGLVLDGVTEDGSVNKTRVAAKDLFDAGRNPKAGSIFDASYVKLREVSLSYSVDQQYLDKLKLSKLTFALIGKNLAILYREIDHIDPEATYGAGNVQGLDMGTMPTTRSLGISVQVGF